LLPLLATAENIARIFSASTIILLFTNGKARFTYANERKNKLRHGEKVSGKRAGIARF